ncbi:hypothetical protein [Arthrobacter sp. NPDC092385]|uniref:hypothetical protein n=1 Tax=Arthrobacter sp. NPDC092385 TaxID=3363943 RepID=UPI0038074C05
MITASSFHRRLHARGTSVDVELPEGAVRWLPSQNHHGENTGTTATHAFFVELKEPGPGPAAGPAPLGPAAPEG